MYGNAATAASAGTNGSALGSSTGVSGGVASRVVNSEQKMPSVYD